MKLSKQVILIAAMFTLAACGNKVRSPEQEQADYDEVMASSAKALA